MPGGHSGSGSQCIHSWSQWTQNIPGWQWHWVFCLLVQGAVSWKPRTCGETRQHAQRRGCTPGDPGPPQAHLTHSGHRGGRAGRWADGSSARCRSVQGTWHKLCPDHGCIQQRRECLEYEWGSRSVREPGFHPYVCHLLCDPGACPSRCLRMRDGQCLSWSPPAGFPGDGVSLPSEAARGTGVPWNPPPCPRRPLARASHLGGSGSSRPGAWVRSIPFPGPGRFGSP